MKKFFIKLATFILLIISLQFLVVLKHPGIPKRARSIRDRIKSKDDIIYFGSSSVYWTYPKGIHGKPISAYLDNILPKYTVTNASINSGKMDIHFAIAQYIVRKSYQPKLIIIPIDLRSFSPVWDMHFEYQYDKEKFYFKHGSIFLDMIYRPFLIGEKIKPSITLKEYYNSKVYNGDKYIGKVGYFRGPRFLTYSDENLKKKIEARYMLRINREHHLIKEMIEIIRLLKDSNINILFYITPIDRQTGQQYLGTIFGERIRENIKTIQAVLAEEGEQALDITFSLAKEEFTWRQDPEFNYMNEHLSESGKLHVARLLVNAIEQKIE